ncbi:MAG TPA: VanZ family protein, partial [Pirellulales bacterium]|nr:VanZ family protein [Pirellulales bacterium]
RGRRWAWAAAIAWWLAMFGGTHSPAPPHPPFGYADKWMHFSAYFGLAALLSLALEMRRPLSRGLFWGLVALLAFYGAFDEITQPIVGRDCDFWDWVADVVGILSGAGCYLAAARIVRRRPSDEVA